LSLFKAKDVISLILMVIIIWIAITMLLA